MQIPEEGSGVFLSDTAVETEEGSGVNVSDAMLTSEEGQQLQFVGIPVGSRTMESDCSSTLSSQAHYVQGSFTSIESQVLADANNLEPDALNPDFGHYPASDNRNEFVPRVSPPLVPHFEQSFMPMEHLSETNESPVTEMVHASAPRTEYEFAHRHMQFEQQIEDEGFMVSERLPPLERLLYRPGMDILNAGVLVQAHGHCEPVWYTEGDRYGIYNEAEIVEAPPNSSGAVAVDPTDGVFSIELVSTPPLSEDFDGVRDLPNFHLDSSSFIRDYLDEEALSFSMRNLNVVCPEHEHRSPPGK